VVPRIGERRLSPMLCLIQIDFDIPVKILCLILVNDEKHILFYFWDRQVQMFEEEGLDGKN